VCCFLNSTTRESKKEREEKKTQNKKKEEMKSFRCIHSVQRRFPPKQKKTKKTKQQQTHTQNTQTHKTNNKKTLTVLNNFFCCLVCVCALLCECLLLFSFFFFFHFWRRELEFKVAPVPQGTSTHQPTFVSDSLPEENRVKRKEVLEV
jgi:Flp pilus assembly protein TadB